MEERSRRIVDTAIELAEEGGFEAVRLRDVAAHAGVALGTVYKRFRSKEDILVAALERNAVLFEKLLLTATIPGDTESARVAAFFDLATRNFLARTNFARAVLRAVASGEPELTEKVARFNTMITRLILAAMRGKSAAAQAGQTELDGRIAFLLQQIWFAAMVGWMGGLHDIEAVVEQMRFAAERLLTSP